MTVAIISDTHDNTPAIVWIIEYLNKQKVATAFHAGDIINPGVIRRFVEHYHGHLHFVFGNNDGAHAQTAHIAAQSDKLTCYNREMEFKLEKKKIFMSHYSYISEAIAKTGEYDLTIGGHDHHYRAEKYGNSLFINPGNTVTKDKWLRQPEIENTSSIVTLDLPSMKHRQIIVKP